MKHTATPWKKQHRGHGVWSVETSDGEYTVAEIIIAREKGKANAAHIVKSVNAHDGLVAALQSLMEYEKNGTPVRPGALVWDDARAALKAAGEEV